MNHILLAISASAMGALSIGIIIYALIPRRSDVYSRISQLSGSSSEKTKQIIFVEQMLDGKEKSKLQDRLIEAGWYTTTTTQYTIYHMVSMAGGICAAAVIDLTQNFSTFGNIAAAIIAICGYYYPKNKLSSSIKMRKRSIQKELPDFLDMVSSTVAAGTALNGAIISAVDMCSGPLGDEVRATLTDIRMGRSRADALNALAVRVKQEDLNQVVRAINQSERVGANLSTVLDDLSQESRERRFARAEEIAGTLSIKMTIPLVFLLLPALFVMLFTPIVAQFNQGDLATVNAKASR